MWFAAWVAGHCFDLVFRTELRTVSNLLNLNTVLCNLAEDLIARVNKHRWERPRSRQLVRMSLRRLRSEPSKHTTQTSELLTADTAPRSWRQQHDVAALLNGMYAAATSMFHTYESADSVRVLAAAPCVSHVTRCVVVCACSKGFACTTPLVCTPSAVLARPSSTW